MTRSVAKRSKSSRQKRSQMASIRPAAPSSKTYLAFSSEPKALPESYPDSEPVLPSSSELETPSDPALPPSEPAASSEQALEPAPSTKQAPDSELAALVPAENSSSTPASSAMPHSSSEPGPAASKRKLNYFNKDHVVPVKLSLPTPPF
ncbi:hypothetical protein PoB_001413400 [Plakobranchus ocellatus]|uniref:Uncharacterized protein n=1 Tax=Plakobranchus ocellatus TaxID=259542 RepID=A0AAV3YX54_9GAST|nr:hypothetical protein PoB_001413400 [Plakobranchus ocellatus]